MTFTFCDGRLSWQFGAQLPMLLASDTSESVAVPVMWPALLVFMPTCRLVLLVSPGASRLNEPDAVTGALPAMLAFSAACWLPLAWLVTLTNAVGEVVLMRTLPRLIGWLLLITGLAVSTTLAPIVPTTPKELDPAAAEPKPLLTPFTVPLVV